MYFNTKNRLLQFQLTLVYDVNVDSSSCKGDFVIFSATSTAFNFPQIYQTCLPAAKTDYPSLIVFLRSPNQTSICVTLDKSAPFHLCQVSAF